jgi:hypothetical protein
MMKPSDVTPRDPGEENFFAWLRRIDPALADWLSRPEALSKSEWEANHRGFWEGHWRVVHRLYELRQMTDDPDKLIGMLVAGLLALKRRRDPRDIALRLFEKIDQHDEHAEAAAQAESQRDTAEPGDDAPGNA